MTTQAIQQEEIEHEETVEQQTQSNHIQSTVCLDEATIIEHEELEEEEEEYEEEQQLEEDEDGMFTLELSEGSDCEDKEYLGKLNGLSYKLEILFNKTNFRYLNS